MQDVQLAGPVLAGDLQARTVYEIQTHTVGELLHLHLGGVGCPEVAQVVALDGAGLLLAASRGGGHALDGAEEKEALRVQAEGAALPQQVVGELDVDIAQVGDNAGRVRRRASAR